MSENIDQPPAPAAAGMAVEARTEVQNAASQASDIGAQAAAAASDLAGQAKTKGAAIAGQAKEQANSAVEQQKGALADRLEDVAQAAHKSGEQLEGHQDFVAKLIERGADELGNFAATLRNNDLNGLLGNMRDLARRQPALFTGASIAAGFALARFGKIAVAGASRDDLPTMPGAKPDGSQ